VEVIFYTGDLGHAGGVSYFLDGQRRNDAGRSVPQMWTRRVKDVGGPLACSRLRENSLKIGWALNRHGGKVTG
jgi:hypothetical protein